MYPVFGTREELIDNNFDLYSFQQKVQMTVKLWITLQNLLLHVDYRIETSYEQRFLQRSERGRTECFNV